MDRLGCSWRLSCLKWTHYKEFFRQWFFFSHQGKLGFFFCIEEEVWIFQRRIVWKWLWGCSPWLNCLAIFHTSAICFNALCAHYMHSSLECKQGKWPLRHLCPQILFHGQRSCPQLDLAPFQTNEREKAGVPLMMWPFTCVQHVEQYFYFLQNIYTKRLEYEAFIGRLYGKYTKYYCCVLNVFVRPKNIFTSIISFSHRSDYWTILG